MTTILAIDPGPVRSAWLVYGMNELDFGIVENEAMFEALDRYMVDVAVIEKVEGFGMAVGAEVFETVFWSGRFAQCLIEHGHARGVERIGRKAVKIILCGTAKAKDPNIRQALIDRFGGPVATRKGGFLYGVSKDVWAALAVAVAFSEKASE